MKQCSKCKIIKPKQNFHTDRTSSDGLTSQCKQCRQKSAAKWKAKNAKKCKALNKLWREKNKDKLREYSKEWFKNNPDYKSNYYKENKERHRELCADWRKKNREKMRKLEKGKLKSDPQFALAYRLRKRLYQAIRGQYKAGSAVRDLGCSIDELKAHIKSQFSTGMTWDNYGEWHIDHIKPLSSFDLTNREQFLEACHYSNLQPLWAKDNLAKGAKIGSYK